MAFPNQTLAGPSLSDVQMEYDFPRPLTVVSKDSNGYRFDIVTPKKPNVVLGKDYYASNSSWYGDRYLIVWPPLNNADDWPSKPVHIKRLKSYAVEFIKNGPLSEDYVLIREQTGGRSCCSIIHAYRTSPKFKKLIAHNNDFFDGSVIPASEHEIELHDNRKPYTSSHVQLKYHPRKFNLKTLAWD